VAGYFEHIRGEGEFLTRRMIIGFSRRTLLNGVSHFTGFYALVNERVKLSYKQFKGCYTWEKLLHNIVQ
jgi:hypothetical protein